MEKIKYTILQDSSYVPNNIEEEFKNQFEYNDLVKRDNRYFSSFVGFIIKDNHVLISFPKRFMSISERKHLVENPAKLQKYMSLLFQVIHKSARRKSERSIGIQKEMDTGYPFNSFFEVYRYYQTYGLYTNEREIRYMGYSGKFDWKKTISKSPILVNKGNILYMPMVIKGGTSDHVFISKCMAHVIDSTANKFSMFLSVNRTGFDTKDVDWSNKGLVISQLRKAKRSIFKDTQKRLVDNLISFFEKENQGEKAVMIKLYTFNLIWEDMVENFLQNYFKNIDSDGFIQFYSTERDRSLPFSKEQFYPDKRDGKGKGNTRRLEPDHFLISNGRRYIFDAKYYQKIDNLNYKQIAYYFLLKHHQGRFDQETQKTVPLKTFNALLLPTERTMEHIDNYNKHFELNPTYNLDEDSFEIIEQYLNVIDLMFSYI